MSWAANRNKKAAKAIFRENVSGLANIAPKAGGRRGTSHGREAGCNGVIANKEAATAIRGLAQGQEGRSIA